MRARTAAPRLGPALASPALWPLALALCAGAWGAGCVAPGTAPDDGAPETAAPLRREALVPRLGGDAAALDETDDAELRRLRLVATNLVAALVQVPELRPEIATLQVNRPTNAFGLVLVRALEDAGYGLQVVTDDRGQNYVGYSRRVAETEVGEVTDYRVAVGAVSLTREYTVEGEAIFPASLLRIEGVERVPDIELADGAFAEQGGPSRSFVSGTRGVGATAGGATIDTVDVYDYDALPVEARTSPDEIIAGSRERSVLAAEAADAPDLDAYAEYRRTVLIFDDPDTSFMGASNKRAVRLLVRDVAPADLLVIRACRDFDGRDDEAMRRGVRVEEELVGLGVSPDSAWIAPCIGASYRHASDDSPVPVELLHYRPRPGGPRGPGSAPPAG